MVAGTETTPESQSTGARRLGLSDMRGVEVVGFRPEHLQQVLELYQAVFGGSAAEKFERRWRWSQEDNPYCEAGSPRWVLVAKGQVVGFLATVPLFYWIEGETIVAHTPCDYMVHPRYRFHGLRLMQACFAACASIVTCDDIHATKQVSRWLGARPVTPVVRFAKLLDPRALNGNRWRKYLPAPLAWPVAQGLRLADLARNGSDGRVHVSPADGFDERFDAFAERLRATTPAMVARDSRFLAWRYGPASPHADCQVGTIADSDGELMGYVVFHRSRRTELGRVLDLQTTPQANQSVQGALLGYAVHALRKAGAWSVHYHRSESPTSIDLSVLRRHGFIPRGRHQLLVRLSDRRLAQVAETASNWNISYGDTEASHASV